MNYLKLITFSLKAVGALLACALLQTSALAANASHQAGEATAGAQAWAEVCGRCHNVRAPTDFTDAEWEPIVTHMRVRAGMTGQESRDVLTFLQAANSPNIQVAAVQKTSAGDGSGQTGKAIYEQTCQACHGADGRGPIPGVPDFTTPSGVLSKSEAVLLKNIRDGYQSPGASMAMPAKGGNPSLGESDLQRVLEYIQSRFGKGGE